jgi:serine protease Do
MNNPTNFDSQEKEPVLVSPTRSSRQFPWTVILSGTAVLLSGTALSISLMGFAHGQNAISWQDKAQLVAGNGTSNIQLAANSSSSRDHGMFSRSSELIADVAQDVAPSVVNIDVQRQGRGMSSSPFSDEFFQRFFGVQPMMPHQMQQGRMPVIKGNGSGVVISADGDVLTNNHVVEGADKIIVTLNDGRKFSARVTGRDPFSDIAVVKMEGATNLKPAKLGTSKSLRPGEWVVAIGSPLGFDHTVTLGIVSALSRQVPDINSNVEFIQTDAAINPGNSGGPLVNLDGEVIGINTAIAGSGQNIGFAIPIDIVKNVTTDLMAAGHVTRPWIGISMTGLNADLAKSLGIAEDTQGVVVAQVMPNSPSYRAGFQQGDVIQRINGAMVKSPKEIQDLVRSKPVNSTFNIQVLRNGQMTAVNLKTEPLPDRPAAAQAQEDGGGY